MISDRLRRIAVLLPPGLAVLDIGSDHGQLPIYLSENRLARRIYATEYRPGPYRNLRAAVARSGQPIEVYRADGLAGAPSGVQAVLIAGLGGAAVASILEAGRFYLARERPLLILEPQSAAGAVRSALGEVGYRIECEFYLTEKNKFYPVIGARFGAPITLTADEAEFGPAALLSRDPVLAAHLARRRAALPDLPVNQPEIQRLERLLSLWKVAV